MKMPDNPNTWMQVINSVGAYISHIPAAVLGAFMAAIVAVLRVVYDQQETKPMRIGLEGTLCGLLTLSAGSVIQWLNMPESIAIGLGGFIGFVGVVKLREWADSYLYSLGKGNNRDDSDRK